MSYGIKEIEEKLNSTKDFQTYTTDIWYSLWVKYKGKDIGHINWSSGSARDFVLKKDNQHLGLFKWEGVDKYIKFVKEVMSAKKTKKYSTGGLTGESAKVKSLTDEYASESLRDEFRKKSKIKNEDISENYVIAFAYTDYGGTFYDKVAIAYFQENYPDNIVVENSGYGGQNAIIWGEPAKQYMEDTEDYLLGFEGMEEFYFQMENEETYNSFEYYLDDLSRDYEFDKEQVMDWLMENKSGYYSLNTDGLDFSYSSLTDELEGEDLIEKKYAKGGSMQKLTEKDFIRKKKFKIGNVLVELEKRTNPIYYSAKYTNTTENEKIGSYGSPNIEDVIYDIRTSKFAKGGKVKKGKKEPMVVRGFFDDEPYEYGSGGAIYVGDKVKIKSGYSQHDDKNAEVVKVMPDNKTLELKIKHKSGNEYVKFEKNEVEKFADGGKMAKGGATLKTFNVLFQFEGVSPKSGWVQMDNEHIIVKALSSVEAKKIATHKFKAKHPNKEFKIIGVENMSEKNDFDEMFSKGIMAKGGEIGKELMGGQPFSEPKPSGAILLEVRRNGREIIVTEDGGKTKERYVKSNGFAGYTLRYKGNQYEFTDTLMAEGGNIYKVKDGENVWYLTYLDSTHFFLSNSEDFKGNPYHIGQFRGRPFYNEVDEWLKSETRKRHSYETGGMTTGWCYSIGGL